MATGGRHLLLFDLGDSYVFKHFIDETDLFQSISEFYESDEYRFEVPPRALDRVRDALVDYGYDVEVVDDPEPYVVVVKRYSPHAKILRESVAHWTRRDHEFFLMPSAHAVEKAERNGATPVDETDLVAGI